MHHGHVRIRYRRDANRDRGHMRYRCDGHRDRDHTHRLNDVLHDHDHILDQLKSGFVYSPYKLYHKILLARKKIKRSLYRPV